MGILKGFINVLADPKLYLHPGRGGRSSSWCGSARRSRRTPFGYGLMGLLDGLLRVRRLRSELPPDHRQAGQRADRRPDLLCCVFLIWYSMREAVLNDRRITAGKGPIEKAESDRVWVWPDLVYTELISLIACSVVLIVWSIFLKAPLEQPANRSMTPESIEGAVVFPRPAGNARLLRSVARRRRPSEV